MAHTTTHAPVTISISGAFTRFFAAIGNALVSLGENSHKMRQINALQALSDAELADRGLERSDIARYVMAESYWA